MMVTTTRITIRPERRKEFFQTITPLTERIRSEQGCITYRLYEESGLENTIILVEEWEDEGNWREHRNGRNFAILLGLVSVVSNPSEIDFKLLSHVGGNEVITDF